MLKGGLVGSLVILASLSQYISTRRRPEVWPSLDESPGWVLSELPAERGKCGAQPLEVWAKPSHLQDLQGKLVSNSTRSPFIYLWDTPAFQYPQNPSFEPWYQLTTDYKLWDTTTSSNGKETLNESKLKKKIRNCRDTIAFLNRPQIRAQIFTSVGTY